MSQYLIVAELFFIVSAVHKNQGEECDSIYTNHNIITEEIKL